MSKKFLKSALGTIACVGLLAGNANALLLDFTDGNTKMTNNNELSSLDATTESSATINYGSFSVRLTSFINGEQGGNLTFNDKEGPGKIDFGTQTFVGDGDGIGIDNDEISSGQILEVAFDPAVTVNEIYFLDLFKNGNEEEWAVATYNSQLDSWTFGSPGPLDDSPNYGAVSIGYNGLNNVVTIELTTSDYYTGVDGMSDFSLAGIAVSPVPEPATMLLFGTGLVGIASLRRKMQR